MRRWLLEQFKQGRTHFVMVHQGKPLLDGPNYDWINVKECYEAVKKALKED